MTAINATHKALLLDVVAAGYAAGFGPRYLARVTGRSKSYIADMARHAGIKLADVHDQQPAALAAALRAYCARTSVRRKV